MRKLYVLLVLVYATYALQAQTSIGLNFGMPAFRPLNSIIDRYNGLRPWLDKDMGNIGFMPGFTISLGLAPNKGKFAFQGLTFRKSSQRVTAKGNDDKRDLSVRLWTLSVFDFTYYPVKIGRLNIGLGAYPIEFSRLKIRGRVNDDDFETYWKSPSTAKLFLVNASTTPHIDLRYRLNPDKSAYLHFRLYWMLSWWSDEHMVFVNDKINGPGVANNQYSTQNMGCSHIGMQFLFDLF